MYSYPRPRAFTDPHIPKAFTAGLNACDICHATAYLEYKTVENNTEIAAESNNKKK